MSEIEFLARKFKYLKYETFLNDLKHYVHRLNYKIRCKCIDFLSVLMILLRYFSRSEKSSENWQLGKIERRALLWGFWKVAQWVAVDNNAKVIAMQSFLWHTSWTVSIGSW